MKKDRGSKQMEVLLVLLYSFILRPQQVFLNRGNHEDISMNSSSHFDPNFMTDVRNKYGNYSTSVFNAAINLFTHLPLATVVKNSVGLSLFVVHGGISDEIDLSKLKTLKDRQQYNNQQ